MPFRGRPILVGEVGWPSRGRMREQALPSPLDQARFVREMLVMADRDGLAINLMEGIDQPWKRSAGGDGRRLLGGAGRGAAAQVPAERAGLGGTPLARGSGRQCGAGSAGDPLGRGPANAAPSPGLGHPGHGRAGSRLFSRAGQPRRCHEQPRSPRLGARLGRTRHRRSERGPRRPGPPHRRAGRADPGLAADPACPRAAAARGGHPGRCARLAQAGDAVWLSPRRRSASPSTAATGISRPPRTRRRWRASWRWRGSDGATGERWESVSARRRRWP